MSWIGSKKMVIPLDLINQTNLLSNYRAGVLLKNILSYGNGLEIKKSDNLNNLCFIGVRQFIEDNNILHKTTYVYFVRLTDNYESFIKIGVSCELHKRYANFKSLGYSVDEAYTYEFPDRKSALSKERYFHKKFKDYKYKPIRLFTGQNECFNMRCLSNLKGGKDE